MALLGCCSLTYFDQLGSVVIALNAPEEQSATTIAEFKKLFLAPGFLSFGSVVIVVALVIIFWFAPRYGKKSMLWYILVCSLIGGLSVSCTQGLGASIVTSIRGENQVRCYRSRALILSDAAAVQKLVHLLFAYIRRHHPVDRDLLSECCTCAFQYRNG